jgi:hypothetical protein
MLEYCVAAPPRQQTHFRLSGEYGDRIDSYHRDYKINLMVTTGGRFP